ncbi:MAG: hypothetical protein AB8G16_01100 [Gammaproteobacteria bacterium]
MESYSWMVLFHIMLLVFWLGTDVGVFLAAKMSERSDLSVETRGTVMQLGMVLDRLPRTGVILILPSGFTLLDRLGLVSLPTALLALIWVAAAAWAIVMWSGFLKPHSAVEALSHKINFFVHVLLVAVLAYVLFVLWGTALPVWAWAKILCVACVLVCGIALDVTFKPAVIAFTDIMTNGANEERDERYRIAIRPVYRWVLGIYFFVILAAYFGVVKPAFV